MPQSNIDLRQLRKAAVLLRSLDAATAAKLLGELSDEEVHLVREAMQDLGETEADERDDVLAEFRRAGSVARDKQQGGVEWDGSAWEDRDPGTSPLAGAMQQPPAAQRMPEHPQLVAGLPKQRTENAAKPFEFLTTAKADDLASFLAREYPQTVAAVLFYLEPARAADVISLLPEPTKRAALDRLLDLGETDPESLKVIERELAEWVELQRSRQSAGSHRMEKVAAILGSVDDAFRDKALARYRTRHGHLADQLLGLVAARDGCQTESEDMRVGEEDSSYRSTDDIYRTDDIELPAAIIPAAIADEDRAADSAPAQNNSCRSANRSEASSLLEKMVATSALASTCEAPVPPSMTFEDLEGWSSAALAEIFGAVQPQVLSLALAGASPRMVDRIIAKLPKRTVKQFENQLVNMAPTRLSEIADAQQTVAAAAARWLSRRRTYLACE